MKGLLDALGLPDPDTGLAPDHSLTKLTAKDFCRAILRSEEYRQSIYQRVILGTLPHNIELMIWDRAEGKVVDKVEIHDSSDPLDNYSADQLHDRAVRLMEIARQLRTNDEVEQPKSNPDDGFPPSSVH